LTYLARIANSQIADNLCTAIFNNWKNNKIENNSELFYILNRSDTIQLRHKIAYLAMSEVSNEEVRKVFEHSILTDLIIESNYVYGPWCITVGNLYGMDQKLFDKIIILMQKESNGYIHERMHRYVYPIAKLIL
jgi:hypothetical protein